MIIGLSVLKAKLRGFQVAGQTIAHKISRSEKERKNRLWDQKRQLGFHCRYHLVAYGLLRGLSYDRTMRKKQQTQSSKAARRDEVARGLEAKSDVDAPAHRAASLGRKSSGSGKMNPVKSGDKLYLVTRRDISPGYQAVQSCHAIRQFVEDHPERDVEWFKGSNYLALLSVADEAELMRLIVSAKDAGLRWSAFREADVRGQITAIAIEPSHKSAELCKNLPLALKELS